MCILPIKQNPDKSSFMEVIHMQQFSSFTSNFIILPNQCLIQKDSQYK